MITFYLKYIKTRQSYCMESTVHNESRGSELEQMLRAEISRLENRESELEASLTRIEEHVKVENKERLETSAALSAELERYHRKYLSDH